MFLCLFINVDYIMEILYNYAEIKKFKEMV